MDSGQNDLMQGIGTMTSMHDLGPAGDIAPGEMRCVHIGETRVLLANVDGSIFATSDVCSHALAYLSEGFLEGAFVECPLHGAQFNVTTGQAVSPPADQDLPTFRIEVVNGRMLIDMD
jgi:3-phenylpropionate/trans-cinnamate dioxygenase ferredoxin subunit/naphthalene 1,2-dioxygenase system ferredoxin subunit